MPPKPSEETVFYILTVESDTLKDESSLSSTHFPRSYRLAQQNVLATGNSAQWLSIECDCGCHTHARLGDIQPT